MEEFQSGDPEDDGSKLIKVKLDECKYYSIYNSDKGIVQLSVSHIDFSRCFVQLVYFDKINNESEEAEALDDL